MLHGRQLHLGGLGLFKVFCQLWRQAPADVLHVVQDGAEGVVDLVGHAGREAADREHFFRLHHQLFHGQALADVVDADHHAAATDAHQRVERQGVLAGGFVLDPGDALDLLHRVTFGGAAQQVEKRLERREGEKHRLVQGFMQACAGKQAGFLVPLGDIQLLIQGDQGRGHGVDDAVEVVLEAGELLLDLVAHLHLHLQLAVGVAGFLGQLAGLLAGHLGLVAGALEFLLARFHAAEHGVEGFGQAAEFIVVAAAGAQGVVLFTGHLTRQLFQAADRSGDQALDLACHHHPQQQAETENHQAGGHNALVETLRQLAGGDQQQVAGRLAGLRQGNQLGGAKVVVAPFIQVFGAFWQLQFFTAWQLRQALAIAAVEGRRTDRAETLQGIQ